MTCGPISRKRDRNGQFLTEKEVTTASLRQLKRRKDRVKQNKTNGSHLYCMYLDACFLKGEPKHDWIMADANIGPLAEAALALIKPSFLPHANYRCDRVRKRYFEFEEGKKQCDIKQDYILDGNNVKGKRKRRRVFRGWRLPKLGWDVEVDKVKDWIKECIKYKALNVVTPEEAYDVIRSFFLQCKKHKSETFYVGYPPIRDSTSEENNNTRDEGLQVSGGLQDEASLETNTEPSVSRELEIQDQIAQSARELFETAPTEGDVAYFSQVQRIIQAAKNDRLFFLLCKISDDVSECKIDCIAAALLDICKADDLKCDIFVTDALQYASARQKGVSDLEKFHLQKHRVRTNTTLLKIARASIPGKIPYEEMTWFNFPLQLSPSGGVHSGGSLSPEGFDHSV